MQTQVSQRAAVPGHLAQPADSLPRNDDAFRGLLGRWLELSELERRAFVAMAQELTASSSVIESSAVDLSRQFQALADNAQAQLARVSVVIAATRTISAGGQEMSLNDAVAFIEQVLVKVIDTVLKMSKNAMRMVYSLDEVTADVAGAAKCLTQLHSINRQTRYLAINAGIEAASSAQSGAFDVIAQEIRNLSNETAVTVDTVSGRIASISASLTRSHAVLSDIATVDMSEHIVAKDRLDALLSGMVAQSANFNAVLSDTADASATLSATVGALVMGLQFQDRVSQQLTHVIEALGTLGEAGTALRGDTRAAVPDCGSPGDIDENLLSSMVENQTLGDVRKRFLAHLIGNGPADEPAADTVADSAGDIELF